MTHDSLERSALLQPLALMLLLGEIGAGVNSYQVLV
jgi:hypothetical protein